MVAHTRSSVGIMRESAIIMKNMRAIRILMNLHLKRWALRYVCFMRYFIGHAVTALEQNRHAHMRNATGSLFLEREFGKCCAMVYCHRRKLSVVTRRALPYREFKEKGSMPIM